MRDNRRSPAVVTWLAALALGVAAASLAAPAAPATTTTTAPPPAGDAKPAVTDAGAAGAEKGDRLRVYAYTLRFRRLDEAIVLVRGLLSANGSVEAQGDSKTLVIRDSLSALARAVPALRRFDHRPRPVTIDLQLLRAGTAEVSPPQPKMSGPIVDKLRKMFRYESYTELARSTLKAEEGADVTYEIGGGYRVEFQLGTVLDESHIRLHGFRVLRLDGGERELVHSDFPLLENQSLAMGLARDEGSPTALFVVLTYQRSGAP
jgi:hypothetical protein